MGEAPSISTAPTSYRLNEKDQIAWLGDGWSAFARDNGAHGIAEGIQGRPVWDFVAGIETRHLYELLFESVRQERSQVVVPFRCDSPDLRRFMQLEVGWVPDGGLQLNAILLRAEPRPAQPLLDADAPRGPEILPICSFCKRIPLEPEGWVEVERAVQALDLFADATLPRLSHGACPDCERDVRRLAGPGE